MNCKICDKEFERPFRSRALYCSDPCRKEAKKNNPFKKEGNLRWINKLREFSKENNIPISYAKPYGVEFLKQNPLVLEMLQMQFKMVGKSLKYAKLPDENRKERRKGYRKISGKKYYDKITKTPEFLEERRKKKREWYQNNIEKERARARKFAQDNKERLKEKRKIKYQENKNK